MRIALITCRRRPEPDPDQPLLLQALRRRGGKVAMHAWDGSGSLRGFDLGVLRSCWNYHRQPQRFVDWLIGAEAATRLRNPAPVVRGNLHKRYLEGLAARGLPIVPTVFVDRGAPVSFAAVLQQQGWTRAVVKPAISAASFRTRSFAIGESAAAQRFLAALLRDRDAMIQRYMPSVDAGGEQACVWIDGEWTHAVNKAPRFHGGLEQVSAALPVDAATRRLGDAALDALAPQLMYARLDLIPDDDGTPLVSELELIEPSLFLLQHPPALERLAAAICR